MQSNNWVHPIHKKGIRPPRVFDNIVGRPLTNRQIDKYSRAGFYSHRRYYRKQLKELQAIQKVFDGPKEKRLVYNTETQEFEEREV